MDMSAQNIKMLEKADEIQEAFVFDRWTTVYIILRDERKPFFGYATDGDMTRPDAKRFYKEFWNDIDCDIVWLLRQDQLQEMLGLPLFGTDEVCYMTLLIMFTI